MEPEWARGLAEPRFYVSLAEFSQAQQVLRRAWEGGAAAVSKIEEQILGVGFFQDTQVHASPETGAILIDVSNLWNFICVLFIRDFGAGRTSRCLNPECPAPYFLKRRRTQKVCELGSCTAWAQRQYALRWWNQHGKKRRSRKANN